MRALPGLGDVLCAVPAWRALRAALPNAQITLVGLLGTEHIVQRFARCNNQLVVALPGFPGLPEQTPPIRTLPTFFCRHAPAPFDGIPCLAGGGVTNAHGVAGRISAGCYLPPAACPDGFVPIGTRAQVWRNLRLLRIGSVCHSNDHRVSAVERD